jgi:hypothetical protein
MYVSGQVLSATDPSGFGATRYSLPLRSNGYQSVIVTATPLCDTAWARVNNPFCGARTSITDPSQIATAQRDLTSRNAVEGTDEGGVTLLNAPRNPDECTGADLASDVLESFYDFIYRNNIGLELGLNVTHGNDQVGFDSQQFSVGINILGQTYWSISEVSNAAGTGIIGSANVSLAGTISSGPIASGLSTSTQSTIAGYVGVGGDFSASTGHGEADISIPGTRRRTGPSGGIGLGAADFRGTRVTGTTLSASPPRPPRYSGCALKIGLPK